MSSSGKFELDAQHTVADLWLLVGLVHRRFYKISTAGNHFFSVQENASQVGSAFLLHSPVCGLLKLSSVHLAALRWTISILPIYLSVLGLQTEEEYSTNGRTSVL